MSSAFAKSLARRGTMCTWKCPSFSSSCVLSLYSWKYMVDVFVLRLRSSAFVTILTVEASSKTSGVSYCA